MSTKQNPRDLGPLPEGIDAGALHAHARAECCDYERDGCLWGHKCLLFQGRRCKHYEGSVLPSRPPLHADYLARSGHDAPLDALEPEDDKRLDILVATAESLLGHSRWVSMAVVQEESGLSRHVVTALWPYVIRGLNLRRHGRGKQRWCRG